MIKGKLKFAIDRDSLRGLVEDLGTARYSLRKLVQGAKSKREWEASEPTRSSTTLSMAFSRVRDSAISLYRAACKCWICDQHRMHTLMMRLEHRIPKGKDRDETSSVVAFRLCFPIEEAILQKIEVVARCSDSRITKTVVGFQHEQVFPCLKNFRTRPAKLK